MIVTSSTETGFQLSRSFEYSHHRMKTNIGKSAISILRTNETNQSTISTVNMSIIDTASPLDWYQSTK